MGKQFLVVGLGQFGYTIAKTLSTGGQEVLAIDTDEDIVQKAYNEKIATHVVTANAIDETTLDSLGVNEDIDVGIVCIGEELESSILITALLKELGVKKVIAKAANTLHGKILEKIGADQVVLPELDMGKTLARQLMSSNIFEELAFSQTHSIINVKTPSWLVGKAIKDAELRKNYGANIVAIKSKDSFTVTPLAEYVLKEDDYLILIVPKDKINEFEAS